MQAPVSYRLYDGEHLVYDSASVSVHDQVFVWTHDQVFVRDPNFGCMIMCLLPACQATWVACWLLRCHAVSAVL